MIVPLLLAMQALSRPRQTKFRAEEE
jgi:hypothetical protein